MVELDKENFEKEVLETKGVVFVDFWSPKCEQCMELFPEIEAFAEKNAGRAKFCKLDTASNRRLSIAQKVMGLPAFVFYLNGERNFMFDAGNIDMDAMQAKLDELACG
jgi:thioredoxin 1